MSSAATARCGGYRYAERAQPQNWYSGGKYPPPKDQIIMQFSTDEKVRQLWTVPICLDSGHEKPGECNWLHAVAADSKGNLYAGDINGKRIQKFVRASPVDKQ